MAELDGSHGSAETEAYFAASRRAAKEPYRAEGMVQGVELGIQQGIAKGIEQGLAARRDLLCRQAARKCGLHTASRLEHITAGIGDIEGLVRAGDAMIECATGEELILRLGNGQACARRPPTRSNRLTSATG